MSFEETLTREVARVKTVLKKYLPLEEGHQKTLLEAMNYSMLAGGKRIRPLLMLLTYEMFGGKSSVVEPFMAGMEMIHTHSLIHDDLPAMDNDEYRRGRKTTHVVYGEAMGILAGDGLLNYAYECMSRAFDMEPENPKVGQALAVMAKKTGIFGMIGGQSVDVEMEGKILSQELLDFIYRLKTGALLEASMMTGAVLAGADREQVAQVEKIAGNIGLAFQIQDDILDVTSTVQMLGKPIRSDEKNHKTTYVTLRGLGQAKKEVERVSKNALEGLLELSEGISELERYEFLRELVIHLMHREN